MRNFILDKQMRRVAKIIAHHARLKRPILGHIVLNLDLYS
jgi:hypothetical protein